MRRIFLGCFPFRSFLLRHDVCCDLHFPPTLHYSSILLFQVFSLSAATFLFFFLARHPPACLAPGPSAPVEGLPPPLAHVLPVIAPSILGDHGHPVGSRQERVAVLTPHRRKRRREETAALSSQNISTQCYPRDAQISRKRGKEEEVRAVQLKCLRVFWHKHQSGLPQQAPVSFWGAIVCSASAHLGTCSSAL